MLTFDLVGLGATFAVPCRPDAGEESEGAVFVAGKPGWCLARFGVGVFAKGVERNDARVLRLEPSAPVRTFCIAYIRDRRAPELRGPGHPPACQHQFARAIGSIA